MTKFPSSSDTDCKKLYLDTRSLLEIHAKDMKIDNLNQTFLTDIVIPLAIYLDRAFPIRHQPYFICFTAKAKGFILFALACDQTIEMITLMN